MPKQKQEYRTFLNPDEITPEERLDRVAEILARIIVRIVREEKTTDVDRMGTGVQGKINK